MRKILKCFLTAFLLTSFLPSCEQGELLNSEADIIEIIISDTINVGLPMITNTTVRIPKLAIKPDEKEKLDEQLKNLKLDFLLTPGAVILNADSVRDFSESQIYTVVSQDKKWRKDYEISFFNATFKIKKLSFKNFEADPAKKYHKFYELDSLGTKLYVWDSGNAGFAITQNNTPADKYPTFSISKGKVGTGARLVTCSTGELGAMFGMPIAAGNLFLGYFNVGMATKKPLEATEFGVPTTMNKPKSIKAWCKYERGAVYKDKNGNVLDVKDRPEIYAVLYEPKKDEEGNPIRLNGANVRDADNIVLIAVMSNEQAEQVRVDNINTDAYVQVEIPFVEKQAFDSEKQKNGDYYITLVCSSSSKGNLFEGAVGSTLCVDEIEFITE